MSDDREMGEICARKPSAINQGTTMELITQRCQVAFLIISHLKDSNACNACNAMDGEGVLLICILVDI